MSRTGRDWATRFPEIATAVAAVPARRVILDGEVVVFDAQLVSHLDLLNTRATR